MKKIIFTSLHLCIFTFFAIGEVLAQPTVTTDTRYARGSNVIFGRSKVVGSAVEKGFCYSSETSMPTISDGKSTKTISNGGVIYKIDGLTPSTKYYVRAYAIDASGGVGYGDPIKVYTIPKGKIQWSYDNGADADANARINAAVKEAVDTYWNNLTSISGVTMSVHYGSGTPTADCSYGGWMRVGPSSSYQRTGTIMHEMNHGIGGGTTYTWYDGSSLMHQGSGTRAWAGERANDVLHFWDNSTSDYIKGDDTHFWPYGINGAHEDNGTEALYTCTSLINQALCEDGMICRDGGYMLPCYMFDQEDTVRYYLKPESEKYGRTTSYLVALTASKYQWREMTAEEVLDNDSAAWTITFDPVTQYYRFQNIGTGQYLKSGSNTNIQVMKGRTDVVLGTGERQFTTRGYWLIYPAAKSAITIEASGAIGSKSFYPDTNNDPELRWIILTADQVENAELKTAAEYKTESEHMLDCAQTLLSVPHVESAESKESKEGSEGAEGSDGSEGSEGSEGVDEIFASKLSSLRSQLATMTRSSQIKNVIADTKTAVTTFLSSVELTDPAQPFDVTFLLEDSIAEAIEYTDETFTLSQEITDMPKGYWRVSVNAFQSPGAQKQAYKDYIAGTDKVTAYITIGTKKQKVCHIAEGAVGERLGYTDINVSSDPKLYVPKNLKNAAQYFDQGLYECGATLRTYTAKVKVGFTATSPAVEGTWTVMRGLRLCFYGTVTDPSAIEETSIPVRSEESGVRSETYDLTGRRIANGQQPTANSLPKGIIIRNGRKILSNQ